MQKFDESTWKPWSNHIVIRPLLELDGFSIFLLPRTPKSRYERILESSCGTWEVLCGIWQHQETIHSDLLEQKLSKVTHNWSSSRHSFEDDSSDMTPPDP
jgi:hypothetical protein